MSSIYAPRQTTAQKVADSKAASLFDSSSQSESLQRKADMANNAAQRAEAPRPNNTGMPDNLKSGIESLSGFSMDDVRVHYNSSKPATVQALAYTQGTDIHVAPGQEKHLPHEAWHVAQQMAGRVSPTTNINGMPVNDNAALEHEADIMGEKAVQMKLDESKTVQRATRWNGVVQRAKLKNYYYHIGPDKINPQKGINTKYALGTGARQDSADYLGRGDDLGPAFYMGDFECLKYYYRKNFTALDVWIYYIEKDLIESEDGKNIMDFTKKQTKENEYNFEPNELFQIAMQLGFRFADEGDVTNSQRPLDLLDDKNTVEFKKCVEKIYPENSEQIINFFEDAKEKAIWKGYLNDIDNQNQKREPLTPADIEYFFEKNVIVKECKKLAEDLAKIFNDNFNDSAEECKTIREKSKEKLDDSQLSGCSEKYNKFLNRKFNHYTYNFVGQTQTAGPEPIQQIAIRRDVEENHLLKEIEQKKFPFPQEQITETQKKLKTIEPKPSAETELNEESLITVLAVEKEEKEKEEKEKEEKEEIEKEEKEEKEKEEKEEKEKKDSKKLEKKNPPKVKTIEGNLNTVLAAIIKKKNLLAEDN